MALKWRNRPFDAIVFDLDGVLINSEELLHQAWSEVYAEHGATFSLTEWGTTVGTRGAVGFDRYGALVERATVPVASREAILDQVRAREVDAIDRYGPLPGVLAWLNAAREAGMALGVATSSSRAWLEERLGSIGIRDRFQATLTPDEGHPPKPAPDLYLGVCELLGVEPARALAIEDSENGANAALAAGMTCLAVPGSVTVWMDFSRAHHVAGSLAELDFAETVTRLGGRGGP